MKNKLKIGQNFSGLYPVHGKMNVLRNVAGEIVNAGTGPNGPFITVQESPERVRSLSVKKIVQM
jgi:hypothetical protein